MRMLVWIVAMFCLSACGDEPQRALEPGPGGSGGGGGSGGTGGGGPLCGSGAIAVGGVCRDACDPRTGADCTDGTCTFLGVDDGEPWGACLPADVDGGARGDACSPATPCGAGFVCIEQTGGGRCVPRCDPADGDTCGDGLRCDPVGGGLGACFPRTCLRASDCPDGQTCATWTRPDGGVDAACIFAVGDGAAGEACTDDEGCASGRCLEDLGICYGACRDNVDCAGEGSCVLYGFEDETQSVWLPTCLRDCADDESCGPGQTCAWFDNRELDVGTVCIPAVGTAGAGAPCRQPEDCRSGRCEVYLQGGTGYCEGGCTDDADCGGQTVCANTARDSAGPDGVWGTADDWETFPRCRGARCTSSRECGDWACSPALERVGSAVEVVHRCIPPAGTAGAGDKCTEMCATGACIQPPFAPPEDCDNGIDDDADGFVDCADLACEPWCNREVCGDGVDDDGDGLVDCGDPDCFFACREMTACSDYADEDGDGLIDCDDPDCCLLDWEDVCTGRRACGEKLCADGKDDDRDGFVDCADRDCFDVPGCQETDCANGLDDDRDGLVDCADTWDCGGICAERSCDDGLDDDRDGLVDCHDDDCAGASHCAEHRCPTGDCCTNGLDDDGDGRTDCQDGDCAITAACTETVCERGNCCRDGVDGDGDGAIDCADDDCARTAACNEGMGYADGACANAADDDGDGLQDCADPDCAFSFECLICYEPCETHADCPGGRCVPGAGLAQHPFGGNFRYAKTCMPN